MSKPDQVKRDKSKPWIEDTAYFQAQATIGNRYEKLLVAKLAGYQILEVEQRDLKFKKDLSELPEFTKTQVDLRIKGWSFEVKSRSKDFMTPNDWQHWPMFVDTVHGFDAKEEKPKAYIFISQGTGALMAAPVNYQDKWTKVKKFDRKRSIWEEFYCVDKKYVMDEKRLVECIRTLNPKPKNN